MLIWYSLVEFIIELSNNFFLALPKRQGIFDKNNIGHLGENIPEHTILVFGKAGIHGFCIHHRVIFFTVKHFKIFEKLVKIQCNARIFLICRRIDALYGEYNPINTGISQITGEVIIQ